MRNHLTERQQSRQLRERALVAEDQLQCIARQLGIRLVDASDPEIDYLDFHYEAGGREYGTRIEAIRGVIAGLQSAQTN